VLVSDILSVASCGTRVVSMKVELDVRGGAENASLTHNLGEGCANTSWLDAHDDRAKALAFSAWPSNSNRPRLQVNRCRCG
jgi:hypothetical protein